MGSTLNPVAANELIEARIEARTAADASIFFIVCFPKVKVEFKNTFKNTFPLGFQHTPLGYATNIRLQLYTA